MKARISVELPSRAKLVAGLTPRDLHEPLVRAEEAVTKAEQALSSARQDLAEHERRVVELPARVHRGELKTAALTDAMRVRDAAALLVAQAEDAFSKARARVEVEGKTALLARDREFERRCEQLERVAKELEPVLVELRDLAHALAAARGPGWHSTLNWECSPRCGS